MRNFVNKKKYHILLSLFVVSVIVWSPIFASGQNSGLRLWFFDVGQGDAQFLDFTSGNQILIDGGPDNTILQKLGKAMPFYDKSIDLIVLTHPHKDHIFGLVEVLKRYKVGKIILPKIEFDSAVFGEFVKIAESKNVPLEYVSEGSVVAIGNFAEFNFLSPEFIEGLARNNFVSENESFGAKGQDLNDSSLVAKFVYGDKVILFTGDAGINIEKKILGRKYNIEADILKVGHHGSKYSSSEEFIKAVNPKYAVIQVGADNRYGHPTEQALNSLSVVGVKILRNDTDGDILFESDGRNLELKIH